MACTRRRVDVHFSVAFTEEIYSGIRRVRICGTEPKHIYLCAAIKNSPLILGCYRFFLKKKVISVDKWSDYVVIT